MHGNIDNDPAPVFFVLIFCCFAIKCIETLRWDFYAQQWRPPPPSLLHDDSLYSIAFLFRFRVGAWRSDRGVTRAARCSLPDPPTDRPPATQNISCTASSSSLYPRRRRRRGEKVRKRDGGGRGGCPLHRFVHGRSEKEKVRRRK